MSSQTQTFPQNTLIYDYIVIPPNYDDPVIHPQRLRDIHTIISLIANTLWKELEILEPDHEDLVYKIRKTNNYNPETFARTLYAKYVLHLLIQEDLDTAYEELPNVLKEYPLQYTEYAWTPSLEIIDVIETYHSNNTPKFPLPPKTYIFTRLLNNLLIHFQRGLCSLDDDICTLLQVYRDALYYRLGYSWTIRCADYLHKRIDRLC